MNKTQKGFTLIELVVVITILGILAAFAFPRFAGLEVQARVAATEGLGGGIRGGSSLAHSMFLVNGGGAVIMEGITITMANGYPDGTATGITAAMQDITGFIPVYTTSPNQVVYTVDGAPAGTCTVTYLENPSDAPTITTVVTAC